MKRFQNQPPCRECAGLTLMEILCALAITALLLGAIMGVLQVTVRTLESTREVMREARVLHGIARVLRNDLEAAFGASEKGIFTLVARAVASDAGGAALEFTTTRSFAPRDKRPASQLCRVEYILRPSERTDGLYELLRKETPYVVGKPLNRDAAITERLADRVAFWRVECYDGSEWKNSWQRNSLPVALRMDLSLGKRKDPIGDSQTIYLAALVNPGTDPMPDQLIIVN